MSCRSILALALLILLPRGVFAGVNLWTSQGPYGGNEGPGSRVSAPILDPRSPSTLYVSSSSGLWKSTDGGAVWRSINRGLFANPQSLVLSPSNPSVLYAVGGEYGFKSVDGGASWSPTAAPPQFYGHRTTLLAVDPSSSDRVLALVSHSDVFTSSTELYRTLDGGASWQVVFELPGSSTVISAVFDPGNPQTVYVDLGESSLYIVKSMDGGTTWAPSSQGLPNPVASLVIDPADPRILYAGGAAGVFKTIDSGASWSRSGNDPLGALSLAIDPSDPRRLYASTIHGLFRSEDSGASWLSVSSIVLGGLAIDPSSPSVLYAGNDEGVVKSTDGGFTWASINQGIVATWVTKLVSPKPGWVYAGLGFQLYESTDSGQTWIGRPQSFHMGHPFLATADDPPVLYAVAEIVRRSTDRGMTWSPVGTGLPQGHVITALAFDPASPGILYAGTEIGLFKLGSDGTWRPSGNGLTPNRRVSSVWVDPNDPNVVYCGSDGVFRSVDRGTSWTRAGLNGVGISSLSGDSRDSRTLYAMGSPPSAGVRLYKSTDGAASWSPIDSRLPKPFALGSVVVDPEDAKTLYIGTFSGVYSSINGGSSWAAMNNGLTALGAQPLVEVVALEPGTRRLHAAPMFQGVVDYDIRPALTLPAVASLPGAGGTNFHSDVAVFNLSGTEEATVTARYRCFGGACGQDAIQSFSLGPRSVAEFPDVVRGLFDAPGTGGAVELETSAPISATSRLYTPGPPLPTTGMFVPGLPPEQADPSQVLLLLSHSADLSVGFRTNIGVFNPNGTDQAVSFSFYDASGTTLGSFERSVAAHGALQLNDPEIVQSLGISGDLPSFSCLVEGDGVRPLNAYASVIDNRSQDPFLVQGSDGWLERFPRLATLVTLPAVASVHGRNGTFFHSDVAVFNSGNFETDVTLRYHCFDASCGTPVQTVTLQPMETRVFSDIVASLFGAPETGGALELESSSRIVAASRLYSPQLSSPTVGMFVPGLEAGEATLSAVLTSLSHSFDPTKGFRTNVGVFNASDVSQAIAIQLFDASGTMLGGFDLSLDAREAYQINDIFLTLGINVDVPAAYSLVHGDGVNPFFAYAAVIDNQSQDPIFIPGQNDPAPPP